MSYFYQKIGSILLIVFTFSLCNFAVAQENEMEQLKNQIQALTQTVELLKSTVAEQQKTIDQLISKPAAQITVPAKNEPDKGLAEEIEKALAQPATTSQPASTPTTQLGNTMNPNISVVGTFDSNWSNDKIDPKCNSLDLSELEVAFQSVIDPYARADVFVTFPADEDPEVEEAFLTSLNLPAGLQLKLGKFHSNFDKVSNAHRHAWPFADTPNVIQNIFGEEGLSETGTELSWLVPNPWDLYIELSGGISKQMNEISFNSGETNDKLYIAHLKFFFDLAPSQTFEVGMSGASGINDPEGHERTYLEGLDLTYKWKPLQANTYKSFTFQNQFLFSQRGQATDNVNSWGFYSLSDYQLAQRWHLGVRYDYSQFPDDNKKKEQAGSAILTYKPSEFQDLRLQYKHTARNYDFDADALYFEWIWVIGAHGAHPY
jgi:hypothetical protein